jgi:integrase/recombinase XerD
VQKSDITESRAFRIFKLSISNERTWDTYSKSLNSFCQYANLSYDEIVKLPIEELQTRLEDWVMSMSERGRKRTGVTRELAAVEKFLDMNRRLYHKKALHGMIKDNQSDTQSGQIPFTREEIKSMLESTTKLRTKALVHFFASSGARPLVLEDPVLRMKHLVDMGENCIAIRCYDNSKSGYDQNSKHGYWVFLIPEACKAIKDYHNSRKLNGEFLDPETPIFGANGQKNDYLTVKAMYQILVDLYKVAGIKREKVGDRYDKAIIYGFRKRFNTILKLGNSVNSNIAEKLMAHTRGLDGVYLTPTRDECFTEFKKAIWELTINDSERNKLTITNLQTEKDKALEESEKVRHQFSRQVRENNRRIDYLEKQVEEMKRSKT